MTILIETQQVPLASDADGGFRVGGTRVTLETLVTLFENGATAEEIAQQFPVLQLADIYAVIGYYLSHRTQIEVYLEERRKLADEVRKMSQTRFDSRNLRERLIARRTQTGI